jgi:hypothetical protein
LLSQKRFNEAGAQMTEEMLQQGLEMFSVDSFKSMYVMGSIEMDTFEALLEYKFGLREIS